MTATMTQSCFTTILVGGKKLEPHSGNMKAYQITTRALQVKLMISPSKLTVSFLSLFIQMFR